MNFALSNFTLTLAKIHDIKQEASGRLLLNSVVQHNLALADVEGKMVTNLVKRKAKVHEAIKNAAANQTVTATAIRLF